MRNPGNNRFALRRPGRPTVPGLGTWASNRRVLASVAVLVAATAGLATAALASSDTSVNAKDAAATVARKPNYLLPVGTLLANGAVPKPSLAGDRGGVGVPSGTAPAPTTPTSGGADQAIAVYSGGAGTLTPAGIATLAMQRGCSAAQAVTATAIAMAESGGSPSAQGDVSLMTPVWDWSAGLWQIRGLKAERNTGGLRDSIANQGAAKNAAAMYTISSGCTTWTPWSTYNTGTYESYLSVAEQAVHYVTGYYRAHGNRYPVVAPPDPAAIVPSGGGANGLIGTQNAGAAAVGTLPKPRVTHAGTQRAGGGSSAATTSSQASSGGGAAARGGSGSGGGSVGGANAGGGAQPKPASSSAPAGVPNPVSSVVSKLPLPKPSSTKPGLPITSISVPKPPLPSVSLPGVHLP